MSFWSPFLRQLVMLVLQSYTMVKKTVLKLAGVKSTLRVCIKIFKSGEYVHYP